MANTKYTLLASLLLAAATSGFSQMGGIIDYNDSSKIPSKRMAQQNEWRNNSKNQPFPAKPRDKWQLGVIGGFFGLVADCPTAGGWDAGIQVRKSIGYVFSIRGSVTYGQTKGLDYRKNPNLINNPDLGAYAAPAGPGFYVHNYKTEAIMPSIDLIASLNNIMFHRKSSKFNLYVLGGFTEFIYKTKMDIFEGVNTPYPYATINNSAFFGRPIADIKSDMKDFFDGDYETDAEVRARSPNFNKAGRGNPQIRHCWDIGGGVDFRLSSNASLSFEVKYAKSNDDYLDGWFKQNGSVFGTTKSDGALTGNIGFNFNLGSSAKKVAPLWWINPLGYAYAELNNPTHMKFPKPVLDDTDNDGVTDQFDIEPNTPAGCPVDTKGKSRDTDGDGVPDCKDKELITPTICQPVDADGVGKCPDPECCKNIVPVATKTCNIGSLPSVAFKSGIKVSKDGQSILASAADQIKANPTCKICVVGHGGASKREQQLSWDRVNAVINFLVEKQGISRDRFVFKYGESGDATTVDLQDCTGEEGPNMVPAPHPQYRKN